jgi:hypothetical protein
MNCVATFFVTPVFSASASAIWDFVIGLAAAIV